MRKTLLQTLLAAFCAISFALRSLGEGWVATAPLEGGGVMLINRRNAMFGGKTSDLPPGVVAIEYLEASSREQKIDTGIVFDLSLDFSAKITAKLSDDYDARSVMLANWYINPTSSLCFEQSRRGNFHKARLYASWGRTASDQVTPNQITGVAQFIGEYNASSRTATLSVGDQSLTSSRIPDSATGNTKTMCVFRDWRAEYTDFGGGLRIYALDISKGGELVRSFQPVKVMVGGVWTGFLYDRVTCSHEPFGNKGSGFFIIGPDI